MTLFIFILKTGLRTRFTVYANFWEEKMSSKVRQFQEFREKMNKKILESGNKEIHRFFALDKNAYSDGALSSETKILLALVASLVLRCNDCVTYHLLRCIRCRAHKRAAL